MDEKITFGGFIVAVISAVVTYFVSHVIGDWWKVRQTKRRLSNALMIESVATLHKLPAVLEEIGKDCARTRAAKSLSLSDACSLSSGFIWTPPIDDMRELIQLLNDAQKARLVIHFYDRWTRLLEFEKRYVALYPLLLDAKLETALREEYSCQIIFLMKQIHLTGWELCELSCQIFRCFRSGNDMDIPVQSDHLWNDEKAFSACAKKYSEKVKQCRDGV